MNTVSKLFFQRETPIFCQNCPMLKIRSHIFFHLQGRINVISTLIHNVDATLIQPWYISWAIYWIDGRCRFQLTSLWSFTKFCYFQNASTISKSRTISDLPACKLLLYYSVLLWFNKRKTCFLSLYILRSLLTLSHTKFHIKWSAANRTWNSRYKKVEKSICKKKSEGLKINCKVQRLVTRKR